MINRCFFAVGGLLSALLLAGCSPGGTGVPGSASPPPSPSSAAPETLVLRYCWSGEGEVRAMEEIIAAWNQQHPELQVRGISGSLKTEQVAAAVAGGAPPDMVIMCNNEAIPGFAHDGVILALDDLLRELRANTDNIIPTSLAWVSYQGKLFGLPFLQDTWGLYYNTQAFIEVGLDPARPPKSPDELWDAARRLTKYNPDGSLARAGYIPDYPAKNLIETSQLFGCSYYDAGSNKVTVDSDRCIQWFAWYRRWYETYNRHGELTKLIASKGSEDEDLFYTGKVAMALLGEWVPGAAYAPHFAPTLQYETAPFPAVDASMYGAGFVNGNAFFIPKGSKDPLGALRFGLYLMTDEPSRHMALQNASVPQLKSLVTDPQLNAIPHFGTFLRIASHPRSWTTPMIKEWSELHDAMESALDAVLTAGADPATSLRDVAQRIQQELDATGP
jgi:multiple sugar transport system substrate-binding protein